MKINTVLGFDFGLARIGVAAGQIVTSSASPLCVLKSSDGAPNWDEVTSLIDEWKPDAFVVGLPFHLDGEEQDLTKRAKRFAHRLEGRYNIKAFLQDERLTSYEAEELLLESEVLSKKLKKMSGKNRSGKNVPEKGQLDMMAAVIITETWMRSK